MSSTTTSSHPSPPRVLLIGIGGPTCSGKTTLTKHILSLLPTSAAAAPSSSSSSSSSASSSSSLTSFIVHQDDFAPPESSLQWNEEVGSADWDDPATSVDWQRLRSTLAHVKAHGALPPDHGSHDESNPLPERAIRTETEDKYRQLFREAIERDNGPTHVVFLDGFLLYYDEEVRDMVDVPIFLRIGKDLLRERRESRGGYVTADGDRWEDPPLYFSHILWPSHLKAHSHLFKDADVEAGTVLPVSAARTPASRTIPDDSKGAAEKVLRLIEVQDQPGKGEPRGIDEIVQEGCEVVLHALREWKGEAVRH